MTFLLTLKKWTILWTTKFAEAINLKLEYMIQNHN